MMYAFFYKEIRIEELNATIEAATFNQTLPFLLLSLILVPINWGLEALKWKIGMANYVNISMKKAFESVLSGVTIGSFTPGRIGEYGGRLLHLSKSEFAHSAWSTFLCSLTQNICNLFFGLIAFLFFLSSYSIPQNQKLLIIGIVSVLLVFLISIIINFRQIPYWFHKIPFFSNWIQSKIKYTHFEKLDNNTLWKVQLIAMIRYLIYIFQYALVIFALSSHLSLWQSMFGVMSIYLIQTILPLTPLMEFSVRGGLAIILFRGVSNELASLTLASYSIWFINLAIPSLIGAVIIILFKKQIQNFKLSPEKISESY